MNRCVCGRDCHLRNAAGAVWCPRCNLWFRPRDRALDAFGVGP